MLNWRSIAAEVCEARKVPLKEVFSPSRYAPTVAARHEIMWRLRRETKLSFYQIGDYLGRDHSTVLLSVRKWEGMVRE